MVLACFLPLKEAKSGGTPRVIPHMAIPAFWSNCTCDFRCSGDWIGSPPPHWKALSYHPPSLQGGSIKRRVTVFAYLLLIDPSIQRSVLLSTVTRFFGLMGRTKPYGVHWDTAAQ